MSKKVLLLTICSLLGIVAGHVCTRSLQEPPLEVSLLGKLETTLVANSSQAAFFDLRLGVFQLAWELQDGPSLKRALRNAAASPASSARDFEIEALLLRFLDVDSRQAIQFALSLPVERRSIVSMFQRWASFDSDSALAALAEVRDDKLRRTIAIELIDVFQTYDSVEELASIAGAGNPRGFLVDGLERLASVDPEGAIRQAERLGEISLRAETFQRIATQWARLDANSALTHLSRIPNPGLRNVFHAAVVREWASSDPDAALQYISSSEGRRLLAVLPVELRYPMARDLAVQRPESAFAVGADLRMEGQALRQSASMRLIGRDLQGAIARLEALPPGLPRQILAADVAIAYARKDPMEALAWIARSNEPLLNGVMQVIVDELGRTDIAAAVDVAVANRVMFVPSRDQLSALPPDELQILADKLVSGGESQQRAIDALLRSWSDRDPPGLWSWLTRQDATAAPRLVKSAAAGFAGRGMSLPPQQVYELPSRLREQWIVHYAAQYAQREPDAAVRWLRQFQHESDYDQWSTAVADVLLAKPGPGIDPATPVFPRAAVGVISSMRTVPPEIVQSAAQMWARSEPREAAQWALGFSDRAARSLGVSVAVSAWTVDDPSSARRWVLGLPQGETRVQALVAQVVQEISSHGSLSAQSVAAFGGTEELEDVITANRAAFATAFQWLASRRPDLATDVLDNHIVDQTLRSSLQTDIEMGTGRLAMGKDLLVPIRK